MNLEPSTPDQPLVTVVVPAWNASTTIDRTLRSVRSQTHRALEIIVVDDGSTDDTPDLVLRHAQVDPRVRLIRQANGGVAAARNTGWQSGIGELVAFVDADDVWAPEKIERQVAALREAGERDPGATTGLVYTGFAAIDADDIISHYVSHSDAGNVLDRMLIGNLVGHGSGALVLRQALVETQGFDPGLRAAGAQGCEDLMFYYRVAAAGYHFAVVPEPLVGYRLIAESMSADLRKMLRSYMIVCDEMARQHPEKRDLVDYGLRHFAATLQRRALVRRQFKYLLPMLAYLARRKPAVAAQVIGIDLPMTSLALARATMGRRMPGLRAWVRRRRNPDAPRLQAPAAPALPRRYLIGDPD